MRVWKWLSIMQIYNLEMQHTLGKVNLAYNLSRQLKSEAAHQKGQVHMENKKFVEQTRIPLNTTDDDIRDALIRILQKDKRQNSVQGLTLVAVFHESVSKISIQSQESVIRDSVVQDLVQYQD